ncbi:hypothetical protein [Kineococcus sp. SYSU DK018]|uniref:hypothetical protein n=1 Tax=Kineococcus sp. SYSU DK018 TaxID=3383139 RepID=UPI003D7EF044
MSEHPTPRPAPPAHRADDPPAPRDPAAEQQLDAALARLDGIGALGVHEHVEVYTGIDQALRERLAGTEG